MIWSESAAEGSGEATIDFKAIIRSSRRTAASVPRWALPFYWLSAACFLCFAGFIWLMAVFCMSMRPVYERRRAPRTP